MPTADNSASHDHVRLPKAAELIANQLRNSIVRGELSEGDFLPTEAQLIERFGMSRPTLREALRILEAESLIEIRRGSRGGARVRPPDGRAAARDTGLLLQYRRATVSQVIEAAIVVETACVRSLALSRTDEQLAILTAAVEEEDDTELSESLRARNEFHHLIVHLSGHVALGVLADVTRSVVDAATTQALEREGRSRRHLAASHAGERTHRKVLRHIADGSADAAAELWARHLHEVGEYLREVLDTDEVIDLLD